MLQNWPIRAKLVVILVVPLVALAVLSAIQVRGNVNSVTAANRTKALATFTVQVNDLVSAIQGERFQSHAAAASGYNVGVQEMTEARGVTDQALTAFRAGEADLPGDARAVLGDLLVSVDDQLVRLIEHREALDRREINLDQDVAFFDPLVRGLLGLNSRVAAGNEEADLVYGTSSLVAIAQAKEALSQQTGGVNRVLFLGQADIIRETQTWIGRQDAWLAQFDATATPQQKQYLVDAIGLVTIPGSPTAVVSAMRDDVIRSKQEGLQPNVTTTEWLAASQGMIAKLHEVEVKVAGDVADAADDIAATATRNALISSAVVAVVLALSVVVSLLVASPMIRQLRRLREGALEVANHSLPDVVERLHRGEPIDTDAEQFPVPATTRDEIGQVAEAFGTVHQVAVRTAVEQAAMRKSIGDTFLNLARRSQALIHRQLKIIDALERKETDPDELEELFRLDHLATRMRRHAEDLIVLSGSKPARGWRRPVPIKDVIRGAVAEVEDYTRVRVLPVGGGAISGHAVGDVIHMLAELIENATSFSPPHTPVQVAGHEVSNGYAIEIEDRGLGMSPEEFRTLNDRLENPPPFDLSTSERLGLFVVGRLAERHGIKVRLRTSPYGGTMAIVLIPGTLLRPDDAGEEPLVDGGARELATVGAGGGASPAALTAGQSELVSRSSAPALPPGGSGSGHGGVGGDQGGAATQATGAGGESAPVTSSGAADVIEAVVAAVSPPAAPPPQSTPLPAPAGTLSPADLPAPPPLRDPIPPVPPSRPQADSGPRSMFGTPSSRGEDEPLIDDLPVFATVRSSWFIADRPRRSTTSQPPAGNDSGAGDDAGSGEPGASPAASARSAAGGPPYSSSAFSAPMTSTQGPIGGGEADQFGVLPSRISARNQPAAPPASSRYPSSHAPDHGPLTPGGGLPGPYRTSRSGGGTAPPPQTTEVGLPRRTRRANLAPELRRDNPPPARQPSTLAGPRTPEEIRAMMSSFQSNFGRGLADGQGSRDGDDQRKVT